MSFWTRMIEGLETRDIDNFKEWHHEEFLHIREDKLVTRDEQCQVYAERFKDPDSTSPLKDAVLISENPYAMEIRWPEEEDGTITTMLVLKKDSKVWRTILSTVPKKQTM